MTKITSPSEMKRLGKTMALRFSEYLNLIIKIDPATESVCMKLDEEGNEWLTLNKTEALELAENLRITAELL